MTKKLGTKPEKNQEVDEPKKCGIVMPISGCSVYSATHWANVLAIIKETLRDTDFETELVSEDDSAGIIQHRIVQNLYNNQMVICDVSSRNANVMFELGLRLAFDKPTIIIKDKNTPYPFDVSAIEYLEYPSDLCYNDILIFKKKLKDKLLATYTASQGNKYKSFLSHFGQFKIAKIEQETVSSNEFILRKLDSIEQQLAESRKPIVKDLSKNPFAQESLFKNDSPLIDGATYQLFMSFVDEETGKELMKLFKNSQELISSFTMFLLAKDSDAFDVFNRAINNASYKTAFLIFAENAIIKELDRRGDIPKATLHKL